MSLFNDNTDYSKIKPQPYESFDEAEQKRENDATSTNEPLTDAQKEEVQRQSGINPVEQTVGDVVRSKP